MKIKAVSGMPVRMFEGKTERSKSMKLINNWKVQRKNFAWEVW
jgi:hypothetical protein